MRNVVHQQTMADRLYRVVQKKMHRV